jgi:hypothetical protein
MPVDLLGIIKMGKLILALLLLVAFLLALNHPRHHPLQVDLVTRDEVKQHFSTETDPISDTGKLNTTQSVVPLSYSNEYSGVVSIDGASLVELTIGSNINLQVPGEDYQLTLSDIYSDEDRVIYELDCKDGAHSLFIFFNDTGRSYLRLSRMTSCYFLKNKSSLYKLYGIFIKTPLWLKNEY